MRPIPEEIAVHPKLLDAMRAACTCGVLGYFEPLGSQEVQISWYSGCRAMFWEEVPAFMATVIQQDRHYWMKRNELGLRRLLDKMEDLASVVRWWEFEVGT